MTLWKVDPAHTDVQFSVRHLMIAKVRGAFTEFSGTLKGDPHDLEKASLHFSIDTSSITTNQAQRDEHLKSADFFDVATYPEITFDSQSIESVGQGTYNVKGALTMKGVTNTMTFTVTMLGEAISPMDASTVASLHAEGAIDRRAYGMTWQQALDKGGVVVSNEVDVTIDVEITKQ